MPSPAPEQLDYLAPAPAGAYNAACQPKTNRLIRFILALLAYPETPLATASNLAHWSGMPSPAKGEEFCQHLRRLGWITPLNTPRHAPHGKLEDVLSGLLPALSRGKQAVLADPHGFCVATHGFVPELADEISALSAELANFHARRHTMLNQHLGLNGSAWALVNIAGQSRMGFWPLLIGQERFVLALGGDPHFDCQEMVDLVWVLHQRYALTP